MKMVAAAPTNTQVRDFIQHRLERALRQRVRYRYVQPRVLREGESYRIESPCCSRNVDPRGGVIDIALLVPGAAQRWCLCARDHANSTWVSRFQNQPLEQLLDLLCVDNERQFWPCAEAWVSTMIYLDHNATTPPAPAVLSAMLPVLSDLWANASSQHGPGQQAKRALGAARGAVARVLGCKPVEVIFTSGATEANHMAVRGLLGAAASERRRVVFSSVEHAGHLRLARWLADSGVQVDLIAVQGDGRLDLPAAQALIAPDVALVSLMAANNETGVLMPVAEVAALTQAAGAALHVDATQFIGKQPFNFSNCGADAVSLSAHKLQGPKGVGALLLRQGVAFAPQTLGSQERGRRGGTENLAGIVGLAAALELMGDVSAEAARVAWLRDTLEAGLARALPGTHIWCQDVARLPGTSYLRFGHLSADVILQRLDRLGVAASSGAACSSGGSEPSHVLSAMGVPACEALAAVRLSLGCGTTLDEVAYLLDALPPLLAPLLREDALAVA